MKRHKDLIKKNNIDTDLFQEGITRKIKIYDEISSVISEDADMCDIHKLNTRIKNLDSEICRD
ncbi:MAG: hypothetical protein WBA74_01695, partial [Cyclobacteriaceae bacterium]